MIISYFVDFDGNFFIKLSIYLLSDSINEFVSQREPLFTRIFIYLFILKIYKLRVYNITLLIIYRSLVNMLNMCNFNPRVNE